MHKTWAHKVIIFKEKAELFYPPYYKQMQRIDIFLNATKNQIFKT